MKTLALWVLLFALSACGHEPTHTLPKGAKQYYAIGLNPDFAGESFASKGGAIYGFMQEFFLKVGSDYGVSFVFIPMAYDSVIGQLKGGGCDAFLSSLAPVLRFRDDFDFSDPLLYTGLVLVVRDDETATSFEQMAGKEVGILYDDVVQLQSKIPEDVFIRPYTDVNVALQLLAARGIDGIIMPLIPAYAYCRDLYAGVLKIATPPMTEMSLKIAVLKGEQAPLLQMVGKALEEYRSNGYYAELLSRWQLSSPSLQHLSDAALNP